MAFATFANHLNFTRAAAVLHVTQPALHMQVRHLEAEAGTPLYARSAKGLRLTPAGESLARAGRDIHQRIRQASADVTGATAAQPLVLCAGEGALLHMLPAGIQRYLAQQAGAGLRIVTLDRDAAVKALRDGAADVAVTSLDAVPKDLMQRPVMVVSPALAVPATHRFARARQPIQTWELAGEPLIVPPPGSPLRTILDATVPDLTPVVETHGWEVMLRCVAWKMGVAVVNAFCVPPKGVVLRPLKGLPSRRYQVLWHPNRDGDARVKALRDALIDSIITG